jgi:hypothetical protein
VALAGVVAAGAPAGAMVVTGPAAIGPFAFVVVLVVVTGTRTRYT